MIKDFFTKKLAVLAVQEKKFPSFKGIGPIGDFEPGEGASVLTKIISTVVGAMSAAAIIYFIIQVILAGYEWISAGGDSQKIQDAQKQLYTAILGLFVILIAVSLVSLIGFLFGGIDFLNLGDIINKLAPK